MGVSFATFEHKSIQVFFSGLWFCRLSLQYPQAPEAKVNSVCNMVLALMGGVYQLEKEDLRCELPPSQGGLSVLRSMQLQPD